MTKYEQLIDEYKHCYVHEMDLKDLKGLFCRTDECDLILLEKKMTIFEKGCVLAEEIGHALTTAGDILDQDSVENKKQEHIARIWSYEKLIPLHSITNAYKANCKGRSELAEFMEVTEEFLVEAIDYYKQKYGLFYRIDSTYVIRFEPLGVIEWFE